MASLDSFKCEREITVRGGTYTYYDLKEAEKNGLAGISKLPRSLKVLLENLLRHEDGNTVKKEDIEAIAQFCQDQGWSFTYSTVQCHIKPQGQDKATAVRSVLKQFFPDIDRSQVVTIGDSPNDVSLFDPAQFTCSVGVANIAKYRDRLQHFPRHLTQGYEAEGFCELAHALINQHIQASSSSR